MQQEVTLTACFKSLRACKTQSRCCMEVRVGSRKPTLGPARRRRRGSRLASRMVSGAALAFLDMTRKVLL